MKAEVMTTEKIANRQFFFILFMIRTTMAIAFLPVLTTADALQDAWISAILSFFGAAALITVIAGLSARFPRETLVQYSQRLLGKWPGRLLSLIPLYAFLLMAATDVRIYAEALITSFLTETPLVFIITVMVLAAALAVLAGIEVIGRAADLFFPLFLFMIVLSLLAPLPQTPALVHNIEPLLARGAGPVLRGAITPVSIISQFMVLTMITPSLNEPKRVLRSSLAALGASSLLLTLSAFMVIIFLGPHRGARATFPFLMMIRGAHITEFLERMEALVVFAWGFGVFIALAAYLFSGARGVAQLIGLKNYRVLIGPMAAIWIVFAVHSYSDVFQLKAAFEPAYVFPEAAIGYVLLPMGILWTAYAFKKLSGRL